MKVNPQQLMDDGYMIIPDCIPPNQLDELRDSFEVLVERQKEIWARERKADAENRQLLSNPRVPLPNSIPLKLRAGDGAVYSNAILHWASNYSTKLRRTIHLAYRAFGSDLFSYRPYINWNMDFTRHLSPGAREIFYAKAKRFAAEFDVIAQTFRAVVDKDEAAFREGLTTLHPGETERMVCVMLLTKLAYKVHRLNSPDVALPPSAQAGAIAWPRRWRVLFRGFGGIRWRRLLRGLCRSRR